MAEFNSADAYIDALNKRLSNLEKDKNSLTLITFGLISRMDKRIFDQEKDGSGAPIGSYKGGEMYVNTAVVGRKKVNAKGKNSTSSKFKNGKARKTTYFPSYSAYKISQGFSSKVNLWLTGNFRRGFATKTFPIVSSSNGVKISLSVRSSKNNPEGKLRSLIIERYPNAFTFTKEERDYVNGKFTELFINTMGGD